MSIAHQTEILQHALAPLLVLSTDTKPTTGIAKGQTLYEINTGVHWVFNGTAWLPKPSFIGQVVNYKSVSLATEETVNIMTATTQNLFIDAVIVHVPDDLTEVETFTSLAIATDDISAIEILSAVEGAKANLSGSFYHVHIGPNVTASTKILQATVTGTAPAKTANVSVFWRSVVAGGYYLNA